MSDATSPNSVKIWQNAAQSIIKATQIPFAITDSLIEFLKLKMSENEAQFLRYFRHTSMNLAELVERSKKPEKEVLEVLEALKIHGVITESKSKHTGTIVYTLLPVFPGLIEFALMKGEKGKEEEKFVHLAEKIMDEFRDGAQGNYDAFMSQAKNFPPITRIVPVEQEIELDPELIIPSQEVSKIIDSQDYVALTHCYCKMEKEILHDPCKVTKRRDLCLVFGKVGEHAVKYGFARQISKEEAKACLKESENEGLVHKAFHMRMDLTQNIEAICSCCPCCCGIFQFYFKGALPLHTVSSYLATSDLENCVGCGICVDRCPIHALEVVDGKVVVDKDRCIGCGVCTHMCTNEPKGIRLQKTGQREIFLVPPRLKAN
jgi:ferredoxin